MSEKILKPALIVGAVVVNAVPVVGTAVSGTLATISAGLGTSAITSLTAAGVGAAFSTAASALAKNPKVAINELSRLNMNVDPSTPRKLAFGWAAESDVRWVEA